MDGGSGSGGGDRDAAAGGAADEPVLVALGAGAEPAAALEAVPLVAAVAGAAQHVALAAAAGAVAGERGVGGGGGDDAAELAGLVEAPDLLGAAEVAAANEDLGQRHVVTALLLRVRVGEERGELGKVAGVCKFGSRRPASEGWAADLCCDW